MGSNFMRDVPLKVHTLVKPVSAWRHHSVGWNSVRDHVSDESRPVGMAPRRVALREGLTFEGHTSVRHTSVREYTSVREHTSVREYTSVRDTSRCARALTA